MFVTYKTFVSKNSEAFRKINSNCFITDNKREADLVISHWNRVGGTKNKSNLFWRYEIESTRQETHEEWHKMEEGKIPHRTGSCW